jgi:hypothetical protein
MILGVVLVCLGLYARQMAGDSSPHGLIELLVGVPALYGGLLILSVLAISTTKIWIWLRVAALLLAAYSAYELFRLASLFS